MINSNFRDLYKIKSASLVCIIVCLFALTYQYQILVGANYYISFQFHYFYIPAALSELLFGHDHDYTSYNQIQGIWQKALIQDGASCKRYNTLETLSNPNCKSKFYDALAAVKEYGKNHPVAQSGDFPIWNDKGGVLFTTLAFILFGIEVTSLFNMYFFIILLSASIYVIAYWNSHWRLFLIICFFIALNIIAVNLAVQGVGLTQQRALGILGIVPFLHLLVAYDFAKNRGDFALMVLQALLLIFAYFMRISAAWMLLTFILPALVFILLFKGKTNLVVTAKQKYLQTAKNVLMTRNLPSLLAIFRPSLARVILKKLLQIVKNNKLIQPSAILFFLFLLFITYRSVVFHSIYEERVEKSRSVWHNAYMSFYYDPELKKDMFVDKFYWDDGVRRAVKRFLILNGRSDEWESIVNSPQAKAKGLFSTGIWDRYAKEIYLNAWRTHTKALIRLYLYSKPKAWFREIRHVTMFPFRAFSSNANSGDKRVLVSGKTREATLFFWSIISTLGVAALTLSRKCLSKRKALKMWLGISVVFGMAQLPWWAAYPWLGVAPDSYLTTILIFLFVACLILSKAIKLLINSAK